MTEKDSVKEAFLIGILFWVAVFILFASLNGCAPVAVAPNLKLPDRECPKLEMPPVPDDVEMDIKGDKIQKLNAGGDVLLRGYVQARKLLQ